MGAGKGHTLLPEVGAACVFRIRIKVRPAVLAKADAVHGAEQG